MHEVLPMRLPDGGRGGGGGGGGSGSGGGGSGGGAEAAEAAEAAAEAEEAHHRHTFTLWLTTENDASLLDERSPLYPLRVQHYPELT